MRIIERLENLKNLLNGCKDIRKTELKENPFMDEDLIKKICITNLSEGEVSSELGIGRLFGGEVYHHFETNYLLYLTKTIIENKLLVALIETRNIEQVEKKEHVEMYFINDKFVHIDEFKNIITSHNKSLKPQK